MPVLGEGGVVENLSLKSKPAESAIRQMPTRLFHQASFTGDSAQIAYQQKAQENFRVNRGTANGTVCISQPFPDESEIDKAIEAFPGDDHLGSDLPTESNKTVSRYVAAGLSLAAFLLAVHVVQQCLVNPEKSAPTFSTESVVFKSATIGCVAQGPIVERPEEGR